jgi:hypothetical protein
MCWWWIFLEKYATFINEEKLHNGDSSEYFGMAIATNE